MFDINEIRRRKTQGVIAGHKDLVPSTILTKGALMEKLNYSELCHQLGANSRNP